MRVVIESKHVLVVETRGWLMPVVFVGVVALHIAASWGPLRTLFAGSRGQTAIMVIVAALLTYWALGYLAFGPLADKRVITFHGVNKSLGIEWILPFNVKLDREMPFTDIKEFVLSAPENKGFCAVRTKNGGMRRLLRVKTDREFGILERLDEITRKKVERIY